MDRRLTDLDCTTPYGNIDIHLKSGRATFINYDKNVMTLGYPSAGDKSRILNIKHKGIEMREGNTEWGAKEHEDYFVIMHGETEY